MVKRRQLHGKLQLRIYAWPGTFPVQRWVQVRSQVSSPCWSPATCFLDIPAPGLRVRSRGRALSSQPQGNVSLLSGETSDLTFMSTNTAVVSIQTFNNFHDLQQMPLKIIYWPSIGGFFHPQIIGMCWNFITVVGSDGWSHLTTRSHQSSVWPCQIQYSVPRTLHILNIEMTTESHWLFGKW